MPLQLERGYRAALTLYSAETNVFTPIVATQALAFSEVAATSLVLALQVRAGLAHSADLRAALASRTAVNTACAARLRLRTEGTGRRRALPHERLRPHPAPPNVGRI